VVNGLNADVDHEFIKGSVDVLILCAWNGFQVWQFNECLDNSPYPTSSESEDCKAALFVFFAKIAAFNTPSAIANPLDACVSNGVVDLLSPACLNVIMPAMRVLVVASGVDFTYFPQQQATGICSENDINSIETANNFLVYPALVAMSAYTPGYGNINSLAYGISSIFLVDRDNVTDQLNALPCSNCLVNYMSDIQAAQAYQQCTVPSLGEYCDPGSGFPSFSMTAYPYCDICEDALEEAQLRFRLCSGIDLNTTYAPPPSWNTPPTDLCINMNIYPAFDNLDGNLVMQLSLQCALEGAPILNCSAWTAAAQSPPSWLNSTITGRFSNYNAAACFDCFDILIMGIAREVSDLSLDLTSICMNNGAWDPTMPSCVNQLGHLMDSYSSCSGWMDLRTRVDMCTDEEWTAISSGSNLTNVIASALYEGNTANDAFDLATGYLSNLGNISNYPCVRCLHDSFAYFVQTNVTSDCIADRNSSACQDALTGMRSNYSICAGQSLSQIEFFNLCNNDEFDAFQGPASSGLREILYRSISSNDAKSASALDLSGISGNTCIDCSDLALNAFFNADGRNQCILAHSGSQCIDALSVANSAFTNCSGQILDLAFPVTACSNEQWNSVISSGFLAGFTASITLSTPSAAISSFRDALSLSLPGAMTYPCINYCVDDLITSVIQIGRVALLTCLIDVGSQACLDTISAPVSTYAACSGQDLSSVLASSTNSTSSSEMSTGSAAVSVLLTGFALLATAV